MSNIFLCSDHHFGHKNILTFKKNDGTPLRVFDDVEHMNQYMVMQHNRVVRPNDKVYFIGDVGLGKSSTGFDILRQMNGEKILIKGNHDIATAATYLEHFKDIRGSHALDGMLLTHIPIHPESLARWRINVHGHLHANRVRYEDGIVDERYQCVCMEQLDDYMPVALEVLKTRIKNLNLPELPKRDIIIA
jgi:calcineurin-like phosphoesterase family protein